MAMNKSENKKAAETARASASITERCAPGSRNAIRILVAEDHTIVRDGLVAVIEQESDMTVVSDAGDGQRAVELWKLHRPDVTLMDLRMPGVDGVNAIYQIRAVDPNARIIVLTTYDGDEDIYRGLRAGAKAYLLKDVRREDLFQCIREVHAGRIHLPPLIAAKLAERLPGDELSPRELEVLRLLAVGKPNKLIGVALSITEVTVKSHVQSMFKKLNVLSRTEAIAVANRRGLLHP
jgi:two-component system NarL family response regulator